MLGHLELLAGRGASGGGASSPPLAPFTTADLSGWAFRDPPVVVYASLFKWLAHPQHGWAGCSDAQKARLRALPTVPVGRALYPPSRVFLRLAEPLLAPLLVEVPRAFGAFDALLGRLGVAAAPERASYVMALTAYASECAGAPLNVNELRTVLRVLQAIALAMPAMGSGVGGLYVPDAQGTLVPAVRAVYDDAPWLAGRLRADPTGGAWGAGSIGGGDLLSAPLSTTSSPRFTLVHPRLSRATCEALGIPALSSRVEEQLSPACQPQPALGSDRGVGEGEAASSSTAVAVRWGEELSSLLHAPALAVALAQLAVAAAASGASGQRSGGFVPSVSAGGRAVPDEIHVALAAAGCGSASTSRAAFRLASLAARIHATLRHIRVVAVDRVETLLVARELVVTPPRGGGVGVRPSPIAPLCSPAPVTFFLTPTVDSAAAALQPPARQTLYLSVSALAEHHSAPGAAAVLARALSDALRRPSHSVGDATQSSTAVASAQLPPVDLAGCELAIGELLRRVCGAHLSQLQPATRPFSSGVAPGGSCDIAAAAAASNPQQLRETVAGLLAALRMPPAAAATGGGGGSDGSDGDDDARGQPGAHPLHPVDAALVTLDATTPFALGEIVAVAVGGGGGAAAWQQPPQQLVYACVQEAAQSEWGGLSTLRVQVRCAATAAPARPLVGSGSGRDGQLQREAPDDEAPEEPEERVLTSAQVFRFKPARAALGAAARHALQATPGTFGDLLGLGDAGGNGAAEVAAPSTATAATAAAAAAAPTATQPLRPVTDADVTSALGALLAQLRLPAALAAPPAPADAQQRAASESHETTSLLLLAEVVASRRSVHEAASEAARLRAEAAQLRAEADALRGAYTCAICCAAPCDAVLVPCGHTLCRECARALREPRCPFDRRAVTSAMPFFRPS